VIATTLVIGVPQIHFAYAVPAVNVFVGALFFASAAALTALFWIRYERLGNISDLIIALAFAISAIIELVMPLATGSLLNSSALSYWSSFGLRFVVAACLCAAAWVDGTTRRRIKCHTMIAVAVLFSTALTIATALWLPHLPKPIDDEPVTSTGTVLHSGLPRGLLLAGTACFLIAAVGFTRRALRDSDATSNWLGVGAVAYAAAMFLTFWSSSLHSDWLTTADLFRFGARVVLLITAAQELISAQRDSVFEARERERRRLAAELHDGLAQELAFLSAQSALACRMSDDNEALLKLREAAERALAEARRAITAYSDAAPVALDVVLADVAEEVERRYECTIDTSLTPIMVDPRTAHELERTAREALTNAVRHSASQAIELRLEADRHRLSLRVRDDGVGFTPDECSGHDAGAHYGLTSMTTRARRLKGTLHVRSARSAGTLVAMDVPLR
jgi:signal transduction histidine kinase